MEYRWKYRKAAHVAANGGFFRQLERHALAFFARSDTLIVTFDNTKSRAARGPHFPWGYNFIRRAGHSHLGVMMSRHNDWFRHAQLWDELTALKDDGFFERFRSVIFYGSSMGGYGALAFAPLAPGCRVVTLMPQTHLDPSVVPFETRFRQGYARGDWSGPFLDGAEGALAAAQVYVFADPYFPPDAKHVYRLPQETTTWLKCTSTGHQSARVLHLMDLLPDLIHKAWAGDLTEEDFIVQWRANRPSRPHVRTVLTAAIERGHLELAKASLNQLSKTQPDWRFPVLQRKLKDAKVGLSNT